MPHEMADDIPAVVEEFGHRSTDEFSGTSESEAEN